MPDRRATPGGPGLGPSTPRFALRVVVARTLRAFADGLVSVLLPAYLIDLGLRAVEVGAVVTGTLLGSAALTLGVGLVAHRLPARRVLLLASLLMGATGLAFAGATGFTLVMVAAIVGTLNPSASDVSVFLPTEQALLADATPAEQRTLVFAWFNVGGAVGAALGALAAAYPEWLARGGIASERAGLRSAFVLYALVALLVAGLYRALPTGAAPARSAGVQRPLERSRRAVFELAALFSLDSFGGGFVVQSLLVLWLERRFGLTITTTASVFFATSLLGGASQLLAPRVARRFGLIETMVFTHLPANGFLILAGLVSSAELAVTLLLLRACLSSMDVPARQSYVMAIVPVEERAAAAAVTNVPRSLAAALPPLLVGFFLEHSVVGWPLVCAGALKALYDVMLFLRFRRTVPVTDP